MLEFTKLITHDSCMDGLATAMIVLDALPDIEVVFAQYGTPSLERLPATSGLLFCDIAPPRDRAAEFVDAGAVVLDHHKHARDIVEQFGTRGHFADESAHAGVSGALLAYWHVWVPQSRRESPAIETFARWVGVRDTWQKKSPEWEAANDLYAAMSSLPRDYWLVPSGIARAMFPTSLELGRLCRAERSRAVSAICDCGTLRMQDAAGRSWAVFPDSHHHVSDAAEALRQRGVAVTCGWFQRVEQGSLRTVLSLRSQDGSVDVGALCKVFGGGGHTRAAGCSLIGDNPLDAVRVLLNEADQ